MFALAVTCASAQSLDSLPSYQPVQAVAGTIRVWGDDQMAAVMKSWQAGFRKHHRAAQFETKLIGTGTGMAGLYTGVADLALMGRESTPSEVMAFEWVFRYKPVGVEVATGSLDVTGKTFALGVFVNKDNPLAQLTLAQLDAIFGGEHLRGARNARTWGDLGLTGEWRDKPITPYGYDAETNTGGFFKRAVLGGSDKWSCALKEFDDMKQPDGSLLDGSQRILDALARDRYGIAYANPRYRNAQVRAIPLATQDGSSFYQATKENLIARKYPLMRVVSIYINRAPGKPVDPKVKEFLRYVLSREGQQAVAREGDFLPLTTDAVSAELRKLD
jgi:phosphate transport system substrate-binding protein